ncbi:NADH oxidase [Colletotrichum incanum]|nr:NADH oxidase [Colletotrichum incanum]
MWRHLVTLPNRLAKAAMAERFGGKDNLPGSKECLNACIQWARGNWGIVITGNVHRKTLAACRTWAEVCSGHGTKAIVQINHPGRQAPFTRSIAPSPVPLDLGSGIFPWLVRKLVYGTPSELTKFQIQDVVKQFVHAAKLSADAGFAGVEIHAAHGYLLSQFLSPASNQREDAYGGSPLARAKIVLDVIHEIRKAVPKTFIMGIKLNSADHQSSNDLRESIEQLKAITETGIDFIEISGGSIEDPKFSTGPNLEKKASTKVREAFFIEFANAIRHEIPHIPVMVTGGIRSRKGMEAIVSGNSCDLVGLARPSVINPMLPKEIILNPEVPDDEAVADAKRLDPWRISKYTSMKAIGTGRETLWYTKQIRRIGSQHGAVDVSS